MQKQHRSKTRAILARRYLVKANEVKLELSIATRWANLAGACPNFRPMLFLHIIYYLILISIFKNPFSLTSSNAESCFESSQSTASR